MVLEGLASVVIDVLDWATSFGSIRLVEPGYVLLQYLVLKIPT